MGLVSPFGSRISDGEGGSTITDNIILEHWRRQRQGVPDGPVSGVYKVKAKHIEGTQLCSIELPCKYKDKELTIVVYE